MRLSSFDWTILGFAVFAIVLLTVIGAFASAIVVALLMAGVVALDCHPNFRFRL